MADRNLDEYKNVEFYAEHTTAKKAGFSKFKVGDDFYFCRYIDGNIAMLSQAYTSAPGRDNGIESVKKNEKLAKRYVFETRGKSQHGFALKAGNGQEIAISPNYASQSEAEHISGRLTGKAKTKKQSPKPASPKKAKAKAKAKPAAKNTAKSKTAAAAAFTAADKRIENYKPLGFYNENGGRADGFNRFEKDGAFYFHYVESGETLLISESYTSKRGRDNGIASVKKNMVLETAYEHHKHKNGKFYFDINAANKQEIATSRWYESEAAALKAAAHLRGEATKSRTGNVEQNYKPLALYEAATKGKKEGFESFKGEDGEHYFAYIKDGKLALISEGYPTATVRDKGLASVEKNMKTESRYVFGKGADGKAGFALRAGNNKEIARSVSYDTAAAAAAGAAALYAIKATRAANVEQNYQPLAFYEKATTGKEDGFESFKGEDGEYYFTYFENGKIALISEGYPTAAVRDKGLASVQKNMTLEDRYVFGTGADGKDGFVLRAGNHKEVARSVGYGSAAAAAAGAAYLMGTRKRASRKPAAAAIAAAGLGAGAAIASTGSAGATTPPATPNPEPAGKAAPIAAAALGAAAVAGVAAAAATPKAEPAVSAPASAAAPVAAAKTGGGGIWGWLKWVLMGLVALAAIFFLFKSCSGGSTDLKAAAPATTTETAAPAAMVTCWNGSKAKTDAACPAKVTCWDESFAVKQSECPAQPAAKAFECWDGSKAAAEAECPAQPVTSSTAATAAPGAKGVAANTSAGTTITSPAPKLSVGNQTTTPTTTKMTAPSVAGRICGPSANVLFDVPTSSPKNVGYLGSNPQFGNSLTYTPDEFFRRLQVKYRTSARDKSFLDLLAKSLGHGSFENMDASMFSNDVLANGTSGLLGFGAQHALQYSTLNVTDETHLEAFKVRSANGTDVHFMKRCGNYMYVCQP